MRTLLRVFRPFAWVLVILVPAIYAAAYMVEGVYEVPLSDASFRFERPWAGLMMLGALLVFVARGFLLRRAAPRLLVSRGAELSRLRTGWRTWFRDLPLGLRTAALLLLGAALMGPQSVHARDRTDVDGIDIVLALDVSGSMTAEDILPNRFVAMQHEVRRFVHRRPNDRIGAVVFGRDAFTLMPLTTDKEALQGVISELELGLVDGQGTAIGSAIGTALNRLRSSTAESKVIILLTDGANSAGSITPEDAAGLAATMEVKIFTVLMGNERAGGLSTTLLGRPSNELDPDLLRRVSDRTGGAHFSAADREGLERSFHTILDQLERSEIEDLGRVYGELYPAFVWPALMLILLEALSSALLIRRWP